MFENLIALLERGVVALEQIAANGAQPSWVTESKGCACKPAEPVEEYPEFSKAWAEQPDIQDAHPSEREMAEADAAHTRREAVKVALRNYGKKFKESARTETLEKLLEECEKPEPAEEKPAATTIVWVPTKDDIRNALVQLSASKGKDVALAVLREIGGADKLGDVPESAYPNIWMRCAEVGNGSN